jgi:hypothetical protein
MIAKALAALLGLGVGGLAVNSLHGQPRRISRALTPRTPCPARSWGTSFECADL